MTDVHRRQMSTMKQRGVPTSGEITTGFERCFRQVHQGQQNVVRTCRASCSARLLVGPRLGSSARFKFVLTEKPPLIGWKFHAGPFSFSAIFPILRNGPLLCVNLLCAMTLAIHSFPFGTSASFGLAKKKWFSQPLVSRSVQA